MYFKCILYYLFIFILYIILFLLFNYLVYFYFSFSHLKTLGFNTVFIFHLILAKRLLNPGAEFWSLPLLQHNYATV